MNDMRPSRRKRRQQTRARAFETLETRTLLAGDPILDGQSLIISEIVADSNSSLLTRTRSAAAEPFAGAAESPDWIEVMNVSERRLDVGGMHLTDDATNPVKWSFPTGSWIGAGGYFVVFASGDDISDPMLDENGYPHANFRLSGSGEYLALTDELGAVVHEFAPVFPEQRTDVSYAVPMDVRRLAGPEAVVEYLVPSGDALEPAWRLSGFVNPDMLEGTSPVGLDTGGGPPEPGETVGFEAIDRSSIDFSRGSIVVLESVPFTESGRVTEWSFFSDKTRTLTPLVLRANGDDFDIAGVGRTQSSDGSGLQTFDFDLQSGSDAVESGGYFFGYKDGDNQTDESGVVVYGRSDSDLIRRYNGPLSGQVTVGRELTGGRQFDRAYSLQAHTQARLAGPLNTDVTDVMSVASSLYLRYPFTVDQVDALQALSLEVRYEDAFVAYLNGVEVANRNVPDDFGFDSTATSNRSLADANRFEEVNISEFIGDLSVGHNVLAVHGFNDRNGGSDFLIDAQLSAVYISSASELSFAAEPTPGRTNKDVVRDFVTAPEFSHERGFFDAPFALELTTPELPTAAIYFTTDGTRPVPDNPNATLYQQPIEIGGTTNFRAASYHDGLLPSGTATHTYVFTGDVVQQDTLQAAVVDDPVWGPQMEASLKALPTLSIVTAESIQVEGEFATSAELIFPDGTEGFQVDAGIEVFGGTAVSFPKRSLRISFKNIYGPSTFVHDVFDDPNGVMEFDQLLLRPGSHDTPFWDGSVGVGSYIRNRWANDRQLDMGHPSPRGRFVQLYLNGTYWGQYQLMERANAAFMAANFGGDKSEYDVLNAGQPIDGDDVAWNALLDALDESYEAVENYLDVVNYADYILMQFYGGNTIDWRSEANWMAGRRREEGAGFQFFAWDSDIVLRSGADSDIVNFGGPGFLATLTGGLYQYADFRKLLAERAQLHFFEDGLFTDANLRDQIDAFVDELQLSVIAETARWGSGRYTPETWHNAVEWIKDTYAPADGPSRAATVIEQMRHAGLFPLSDQPEFSVNGNPAGEFVDVGGELSMSATRGDIYYTLNGSDPWQNHPTVSYTPFVGEDSPVHAIVPADGSFRQDWQLAGFDDTSWIAGENGVGYDTTGELNPLVRLDLEQQMKDVNATAYLRFPFHVDDPGQFEALEFSIRYDDAFVAYLNGVEVARRNAPAVVGWNSRARVAHANVEAIEFEGFNLARDIGLLNSGQNVLAIHALNTEPGNVDMLMTPLLRAGFVTDLGLSSVAIRYTDSVSVPANAKIVARSVWGDQWSAPRQVSADSQPFPLRISEVMYHPAAPSDAELAAGYSSDDDFEFIELVNISDSTINLLDVALTQTTLGGQPEGVELDFGRGAIRQLGPGQRVLVVEDQRAFAFRYGNQLPVAGQWTGGLSNGTEQITLTLGDQILQQFAYDDGWHPETDGAGASLEVIDESDPDLARWQQRTGWRPSATLGGTPGRSSRPEPVVGDSNNDGVFDSDDLLFVFGAGEFEDDALGNSTFADGDWNGDGEFDSADLVFAFKSGTYAAGAARGSDRDARGVAAASLFPIGGRENLQPKDEVAGLRGSNDRRPLEVPLASRDLIFSGLGDDQDL